MINQYIFDVDLVHLQHVNKLFETRINRWILVTEKSILDAAGVADPPVCVLGESIYKK